MQIGCVRPIYNNGRVNRSSALAAETAQRLQCAHVAAVGWHDHVDALDLSRQVTVIGSQPPLELLNGARQNLPAPLVLSSFRVARISSPPTPLVRLACTVKREAPHRR